MSRSIHWTSALGRFTLVLAAVAALGLFATSSQAGTVMVPDLGISLMINGEPVELPSIPGQGTEDPNVFNWNGTVQTTAFVLKVDTTGDVDPFVTNNLVVTNLTGVTNNYSFTVTLPVLPVGPSSLTGGSVSASLTANGNGGTLATVGPGTSMYMSRIDGADFVALLADPQSTSAGPFGSNTIGPASFGLPGVTFPGPAVTTNIGIRLNFSLTPGDQASFTSIFVVNPVPEPSTVTLLGLGLVGLAVAVARRRNRG